MQTTPLPGWIGFTFYPGSVLSRAIAYFTRWSRGSFPTVSHALVVAGANECIEAHIQFGVQLADLNKYRLDEKAQIYYRVPRGFTAELGNRIVREANLRVGDAYDTGLIGGMALGGSLLGHLAHLHPAGGRSDREICSELVAIALKAQSEYAGAKLLQETSQVDPQELFGDDELFEPGFLNGHA